MVFDRFHIVKLVNDPLDKLLRLLVRRARGIVQHEAIRGTRCLLLTRRDCLDGDKLQALDAARRENTGLILALTQDAEGSYSKTHLLEELALA